MEERVNCKNCNASILPQTAERTSGLCKPCFNKLNQVLPPRVIREQAREKPQTTLQRENGKRKLLRKLVANARNIISNEVGVPVGVWKMERLIRWLEISDIVLTFPVFGEYQKSVRAIPTGKERLYCSRDALRRYDADLNQINLHFHESIIDACFEIIETYGKVVDNPEANEQEKENASK
jgi:hypothetical protein